MRKSTKLGKHPNVQMHFTKRLSNKKVTAHQSTLGSYWPQSTGKGLMVQPLDEMRVWSRSDVDDCDSDDDDDGSQVNTSPVTPLSKPKPWARFSRADQASSSRLRGSEDVLSIDLWISNELAVLKVLISRFPTAAIPSPVPCCWCFFLGNQTSFLQRRLMYSLLPPIFSLGRPLARLDVACLNSQAKCRYLARCSQVRDRT